MRPLPLVLVLVGCSSAEPIPQTPNLLVVLLDDVGVDKIAAYGENPDAPPTPTFDALAAQGLLFRWAWADPKCSPTRAGLLTGRYGFRYGIGDHLEPSDQWALPLTEETLPERLASAGYASAVAGKWHLGDLSDRESAAMHPLESGFDHHDGALANLHSGPAFDGPEQDYFHYEINHDGKLSMRTGYATEDTTDDALRSIRTLPEPWFVYVAYNAPHAPHHAPPEHLNPGGVPDDAAQPDLYDAMLRSVDLELGRLLAETDAGVLGRTIVVVLGDNGTPPDVKTGPAAGEPGKGTVHDSGIQVPLIVVGPGVVQGETTAFVQHTDLFATATDLAGVGGIDPRDSISFAGLLADPGRPHLRDVSYTERFRPNGPGVRTTWRRAIRGERYKLIQDLDGTEELYDLHADPEEGAELLAAPLSDDAQRALEDLRARAELILSP